MFVVRTAQIAALRRGVRQRFVAEVAAHVRQHFPDAVPSADVEPLVEHGFERATAHGFESRSDVYKYVDLAVVLGRDFDTDVPWARDILADGSFSDASVKMQFLCREAIHRLTPRED